MTMAPMSDRQLLLALSYAVKRVEAKLDRLISELAGESEQDQQPAATLDGEPAGAPRAEGEPL